MTATLARRERAALCDLALELGPDARTLCAGWTAKDLVIHLLVRERRPLGTAGIMVPALSGFTERASARYDRQEHDALVERLRSVGPLFALPGVDAAANTVELVVHHEDLRRGVPGWQPRLLDPADADALWAQLRRAMPLVGRKLPVPTVIRRADTGATTVGKKGPDPVTVTGDVVELILFLFGRAETRDLVFEGSDEAVAAVRAADLGV
ncbi:TIGR03085 family metal-binding protein [Nocardioides sp. URHA0020]|uniref:TIGR03085 family metal-binding protein n=1 Tax=Nocardioides sp. URHA0020 TaxID=1380392 RepID=UPI00055B966B|nr:TIGR03085 family metal-binding protein [Nocardioides sp. URHA0020]